jgi:hypothetical protein
MNPVPNLDRARTTYRELREIWLASSILDAHERLAAITVAAGVRQFAFLCHLSSRSRKRAAQLLSTLGFATTIFAIRFDLVLEGHGIDREVAEAYRSYKCRNDRFLGIGMWADQTGHTGQTAISAITASNLGSVLAYPECCAQMDFQTKLHDHQLFLRALIAEVGKKSQDISRALSRRYNVSKPSDTHLKKWAKRYELTLARFPFALHTACDTCLDSASSPTALLNSSYEDIARQVSEELHFLVRWGAHIGDGGRH